MLIPALIAVTLVVIASLGVTGGGGHLRSPAGGTGAPPDPVVPQLPPLILTSPDPVAGGVFGTAVAVSGTTVVVGAPLEWAGGIMSGLAFIVNTATGQIIQLSSPNPITGGGFGSAVAISGATVIVGAPGETAFNAAGAGHAYTFSATTGALIATLASPAGGYEGEFGFSVAISGSTAVIGAPGEPYLDNEGRAYIANLKTGLDRMLSSPNAQVGGGFGCSVGISGTTVVVGAEGEYASSPYGGHAYTFSANTGDLIATYTSPNAQTNGYFGAAVAVSGATVVVGAPGESFAGLKLAGTAYLINVATEVVTQVSSPNAQAGGQFGQSVAMSGTTVAVGAPDQGDGNAYTFGVPHGNLTLGNFSSPNPTPSGLFGSSVAISGSTLIVGAPSEQTLGNPSIALGGNAYDFVDLPIALTSPDVSPSGFFGYSVAVSGSTIVVGAFGESVSGLDQAGHAYIIDRATGAITMLTSPNPQAYGSFGWSVAISGATVVVGAPLEAVSSLASAGHAYLFNATTGAPLATLTSPNEQLYGEFGDSVAISGSTVVVGADTEMVSGDASAGRAYTFSASTAAPIATLTSPNVQAGGEFGSSVGISGSTVVVGAPDESSTGLASAGNAYTFSATSGAPIATFTSPNAQASGEFGYSVGISGTTVVVGAPFETALGDFQAGNVYLFSTVGATLIASMTSPDAQAGGFFGFSVAISGSTVAVGAPDETAWGDSGAGNAYTFSSTSGVSTDHFYSPNFQADGWFGTSVAVSALGTVVGAYTETASAQSDAGHAYLF